MVTKLAYTDELVREIDRLSRAFTRIYADSVRPLALTPAEADALRLLMGTAEVEAPSLKRIGEMSNLETPPSRLMKSLRDRDLVVQERDKTDERVYRYKLSKKGRSMAKRADKARNAALSVLGEKATSPSIGKALRAIAAIRV